MIRDGFSKELSFKQEKLALQRNENRIFLAEEIANAKALKWGLAYHIKEKK